MLFAVSPTLALSLAMPGGGFAASAYPLILLAAAMVLFGAALLLWFATGNVIGPFVVWGAALLISFGIDGRAATTPSIYAIFAAGPAALMGLWAVKYSLWHWRQVKLKNLNAELNEVQTPARLTDIPSGDERPELSETQLAQMRFFLDRALQPISEFEGFEHLDDFQTAAVRYQINFISYALSMAQYTCLKARGGI